VCDCSDQAAHYHNLGPKLGASLLTWHIGWKEKKESKKKSRDGSEYLKSKGRKMLMVHDGASYLHNI
jgi:hypothetical protein